MKQSVEVAENPKCLTGPYIFVSTDADGDVFEFYANEPHYLKPLPTESQDIEIHGRINNYTKWFNIDLKIDQFRQDIANEIITDVVDRMTELGCSDSFNTADEFAVYNIGFLKVLGTMINNTIYKLQVATPDFIEEHEKIKGGMKE